MTKKEQNLKDGARKQKWEINKGEIFKEIRERK